MRTLPLALAATLAFAGGLAGARLRPAEARTPPAAITPAEASPPEARGDTVTPSVRRTGADGVRELRVCADPNNLPFSDGAGRGFENRLAEMIAADLHARVRYTWWAQRRGFFRSTLKAGLCDVVLGMPSSMEMAWTTRPYYRSGYVFLSRKDRGIGVASLDDPALARMKIGVQVLGDDGANPPAVHALTRRGMARNLVGYSVYGDYARQAPPAAIVDGVARGDVDVAVVWGPLAGYFARRSGTEMRMVPVTPQIDLPYMPFAFDISMGTRRSDTALHAELEEFIRRRGDRIARLLDEYGVPRQDAAAPVEEVR